MVHPRRSGGDVSASALLPPLQIESDQDGLRHPRPIVPRARHDARQPAHAHDGAFGAARHLWVRSAPLIATDDPPCMHGLTTAPHPHRYNRARTSRALLRQEHSPGLDGGEGSSPGAGGPGTPGWRPASPKEDAKTTARFGAKKDTPHLSVLKGSAKDAKVADGDPGAVSGAVPQAPAPPPPAARGAADAVPSTAPASELSKKEKKAIAKTSRATGNESDRSNASGAGAGAKKGANKAAATSRAKGGAKAAKEAGTGLAAIAE